MSPRPSRRRKLNISPRQLSRSTSVNCSCDLKSAPVSEAASGERSLEYAAERLRLADRDGELAAAQVGRDRGAPELGASRWRCARPTGAGRGRTRSARRAPIGTRFQSRSLLVSRRIVADVGREIELLGGERALQGLAAVGGEGEHALGGVAVKFDVDGRERDRAAGDVGLGLEREAAEAAAGERLEPGPAQRVAQRRGVGRRRVPSIFSVGRMLIVPSKASLTRRAAELASSRRSARRRARLRNRSAPIEVSIGSPCHTKRPVAAKLLEIEGHASASSTSRQRLRRRRASRR